MTYLVWYTRSLWLFQLPTRGVSSLATWHAIYPRGVRLLLAIVARGVLLLTQGGVRPLLSDSSWPPLPPRAQQPTAAKYSQRQHSTLPFPPSSGDLAMQEVLSLTPARLLSPYPCLRHHHFQQRDFGVLCRVNSSIEFLLSPPKDQSAGVCGDALKRHSSKITSFIPWAGFAEVLLLF